MKKFLIFIVIIITYNITSSFTLDNTREKANKIINNIELYKKDTGEYPKNLDNLIPKYYKKIPKHYSSIKRDFIYFYYEKDNNFSLIYIYNLPFGKYSYNSMTKKWNNLD